MQLELNRMKTVVAQNGYTPGELMIDGSLFCYTLEDELREHKIPGETAIPPGFYGLELVNSPRFGTNTISLKDVPGFGLIRVHAGNKEKDTDGCILVGEVLTGNTLVNSRTALDRLKAHLVPFISSGGVAYIKVINYPGDRFVDTGRVA